MRIYKETIQAVTASGKIEYQCHLLHTGITDIRKYETEDYCTALCKRGCANYENKWSCPPYAPSYYEFAKDYKTIIPCLLTVDMGQFDYINSDYFKTRAAKSILKSRIDRVLRSLIDKGVYYIASGSCRLCKNCKCKLQEACIHPDIMGYSFEALGIDVAGMVNDLFGIPLPKYKKDALPRYTGVVAGLVCKEDYDMDRIISALNNLK